MRRTQTFIIPFCACGGLVMPDISTLILRNGVGALLTSSFFTIIFVHGHAVEKTFRG